MQFYARNYNEPAKENLNYPCFYLVSDSWDDYGSKTTFVLQFYAKDKTRTVIGSVKIMDLKDEGVGGRTRLPETFDVLDDDFCSLGSNSQYYSRLKSIEEEVDIKNVLESLNDAAFLPGIRSTFESTSIFINSLIREREAKSALILGEGIINGQEKGPKLEFTFQTTLRKADLPHFVSFSFERNLLLPKRIYSIVGKNGTGKTQFLANLSNALGYSKRSKKAVTTLQDLKEYETGVFDTELGPPFSKIIALSYSIFDSFKRPTPSKRYSYVYCGIRNDDDEIDKKQLLKRHVTSLRHINSNNLNQIWFDAISKFVDPVSIGYKLQEWFFTIQNIDEIEAENNLNLSSGQSILLYTLTELIAHVTANSLILFDEPETHLHPNAIANLINVVNNIVNQFDSFAIICTHSPLVIQETPSSNVWIFERDGNMPITRPLDIESYGENLTVVTEHIFDTGSVQDGYKITLQKLAAKYSYDDVLLMFKSKLSLNAKMYLTSLYE